MATSIEGRTLGKPSTQSQRDSMLGGLTSEQRRGAMVFLPDVGWQGYTGTTWESFTTQRNEDIIMQANTQGITTQPTGLCAVNFKFPFGVGPLPTVVVNHATTQFSAPALIIRPYTLSGYITRDGFHVSVRNPDQSAAGSVYLDISWVAVGVRPRST